jgi:hypothetical protein
MKIVLALALVVISWGGCVKPYQREFLSQRMMQPGAERSEAKFCQHWQVAREGSVGGLGTVGGGCGCN